MRFFLLYLLLLCTWADLFGQASPSVLLKGQVVDSNSGTPMEYATISVFNDNNKLISGSITSRNGTFSVALEPGTYYAEIQFLSYKKNTIPNIQITGERSVIELGVFKMQEMSENINEATVIGEKSEMIFSLDKKVFNVGKDLSNTGKSVLDILDNIPSVAVDVDGNVSVRGSQEIQVLIDGKPSGLVSSGNTEALKNLQGNMIDRIEVITNPSARYEAEGMSGIINIVLKKDNQEGFHGSLEAGIGNPDDYNLNANVSFRRTKLNYFLNYNIHYHERPGNGHSYQSFNLPDTAYITLIERERLRSGLTNRLRGGFDLFINPTNIVTASFMLALDGHNNTTDVNYNDQTLADDPILSTHRRDNQGEIQQDLEYSLNYEKNFGSEEHKLNAQFQFIQDKEEEKSDIIETTRFFLNDLLTDSIINQYSHNDENEYNYLIKVDYILPYSSNGKFETGYQSTFRKIDKPYRVEEINNDSSWILSEYSNNFHYSENIYALYVQAGNSFKALSLQMGVRAELSDVKTRLEETNENNHSQYWKFFPSMHASYMFDKNNSVQLSYTRRIRRPNFRMLNPFHDYSDSRNIHTGNPKLLPELTHALETGYLMKQPMADIYAGVFYRYTTDAIERINHVDTLGITYMMPSNFATRQSFGFEANASYDIKKWWTANASGNFYRKITEGEYLTKKLSSDDYSWDLRFNLKIRMPKIFDFQTVFFYRAPEETTQGNRKAFYFINAAVSKDILKGNGTLTLNVQDLLDSRKMRFVLLQPEQYAEEEFRWSSRFVSLTFIYRLNQKKGMKNHGNEQDEGSGNSDDMME